MKFVLALLAIVALSASASADTCRLGHTEALQRSFTLPVNGVCIISKVSRPGVEYVGIKPDIAPKNGQFGRHSAAEMAYRAGSKPGGDYFEYISIEKHGGAEKQFRIKNWVTIVPK